MKDCTASSIRLGVFHKESAWSPVAEVDEDQLADGDIFDATVDGVDGGCIIGDLVSSEEVGWGFLLTNGAFIDEG